MIVIDDNTTRLNIVLKVPVSGKTKVQIWILNKLLNPSIYFENSNDQ